MKKTFYVLGILLWILFPGKASGQNDNYCYTLTRTLLQPDDSVGIAEIKYYNAKGDVWQSFLKGYTPTKKNLFTCTEYDGLGREARTWLPIYSAKDYLAANDLNSLASPQYGGESYCYERVSYNNSPLNRVAARYAPGSAWNVHPSTTEYLSNTASGVLACKRYEVGTSGGVTQSGNFASRTLRVTKTADEDGHSVYDFRDVDGKTVLVRRVSGNTYYDTYYVYDAYRRLRYVLQPGYQDEADLSLHAFCYTYDERGRCTELKKPGTGTIRYGYGNNDLMLFSQDEKQQAANLMTFYLYDKTHRLVVKGECEIPLNFAGAEQATICTYTGPGTGIDGCGYTANFNFPSPVLQLVNFYDDYSFRTGTGFNNTNFPAPVGNYSCGRKTGSIVYVPGQDTRLYKAYYYSMRGNLIREVSSNLRGGYDTTETTYSFTDRPSHSTHTHTAQNAPTLTEAYDYTYDHADRLTKVEHTFGGVKQTLLAHTYDELCRLSHTDYHGSSANRLTYSYNTRGWLTAISGNKFSQNLYYNTGNGTPCYNGNISSMTWKAGNETTLRGYKFTYDGLNRMLDAIYGEGTNIGSNVNRFTEKVTGYDKNGNILVLQRYGQTGTSSYGLIDNLTFTLDGNQLNRVDDAVTASAYNGGFEFKDAVKQADEYTYDANGNLTKDLNKNISEIQYNCLNLPRKVTFTDGSTIEYTYAADGTKLRTKHVINGTTTTTTDYCGNVIYENGVQKLLLTEAGYLTLADSKYHYYLQDHQGNNRVVIDQNGTVEEANHYYPFGGVFANSTSVQPYKYNGKELDTKKGLNWYDYGARHYDAALGRFATVDPSSESYYETSPYAYCGNNPVVRIDPTGADYWSTSDPEQIRRFMEAMNEFPNAGGNWYNEIDFSSWNHSSDSDFLANLTFNDQTNMFYYNYGAVENGIATRIGVAFPVLSNDEGIAYWEGARSKWFAKATGRIESVHPEYAILGGSTKIGRTLLKSIWNILNPTFSSINTINANASKDIIYKEFKEVKEFGFLHGQKVYQYKGKFYSRDIDSHNGGVWKVFKLVNGKLVRVGTADAKLNIFKK